jgi:hypothetical protein
MSALKQNLKNSILKTKQQSRPTSTLTIKTKTTEMNKVIQYSADSEYYLDFYSRETYLARVEVWKRSYKRRVCLVQLEKRQARAAAHQRNELFSLFQTSNFYYKESYRWPKWAVAALRAGLQEITDLEAELNRRQAWFDEGVLLDTSVEKLVLIRRSMKAKSHYLYSLSHPHKPQAACPTQVATPVTQLSLRQTAPALQLQFLCQLGWY